MEIRSIWLAEIGCLTMSTHWPLSNTLLTSIKSSFTINLVMQSVKCSSSSCCIYLLNFCPFQNDECWRTSMMSSVRRLFIIIQNLSTYSKHFTRNHILVIHSYQPYYVHIKRTRLILGE